MDGGQGLRGERGKKRSQQEKKESALALGVPFPRANQHGAPPNWEHWGVGRKSLVQALLWLLLTQDRARAAFPLC